MTYKETLKHIRELYNNIDPEGPYSFGITTNSAFGYHEYLFGIALDGKIQWETDKWEDYLEQVLLLIKETTNETR